MRPKYKELYRQEQAKVRELQKELAWWKQREKDQREVVALHKQKSAEVSFQVEQLVSQIQKMKKKGVELPKNPNLFDTSLSSNYMQKIGVYESALKDEADFWEETLGSDAPPSLAKQQRAKRLDVILKALSC